ncbi:glycerophosphodiester phosphodiesterase [Saccharobesus litoralis]|uniref:Glycerophosphodiester phosphodiesterase n=1 Tax=Saccharobesus litoralis TaxID=2172099 RepID=A0A2S0VWL1_9ALTE|nr:glycerophosphodiester phosphodiesterase family protein [Saccharobesus litoralis]AWB68607.1 glycerophosphodiester phosphodiesterase [Saccharobesus litoralis]
MWIFAHRGASGHAPENTLKAISLAMDMQCDGIEIDVHECDGQLIVIHNRWLNSTTNGQGIIHQHSFAHLRSLDAGLGEKIPTLREVLTCVKGRCMVNIEVKSWLTERLVLAEMDYAVQSLGFSDQQLILSSFNHHILHAAKQQRPQTLIGALTSCIPLHYAHFAQELQAFSVNCDIDFINQAMVDDAHQRGLKVLVYTANELDDIESMAKLGVDGVFTNYPTRAMSRLAHKL